MPKCLICNTDREFHKLGQHIRTIHKMSVDDYKELFPNAETVSKEYSEFRSKIIKEEYATGKMDTSDRRKQVELFNKKGIEYKQSAEGRKSASELQKRIWDSLSDEDKVSKIDKLTNNQNSCSEFRKKLNKQEDANCKVPLSKQEVLKRLEEGKRAYLDNPDNKELISQRQRAKSLKRWENPKAHQEYGNWLKTRWATDENYRKAMSIRSMKALKNSKSTMTSIHRKVSEYLSSIGLHHLNEEIVCGVSVDIYLPSLDKVIECNGEFWHGNPDILPVEDMNRYQYEGYKRDLKRKSIFGDRVLFLWESEINDDSFKDKLNKFIMN